MSQVSLTSTEVITRNKTLFTYTVITWKIVCRGYMYINYKMLILVNQPCFKAYGIILNWSWQPIKFYIIIQSWIRTTYICRYLHKFMHLDCQLLEVHLYIARPKSETLENFMHESSPLHVLQLPVFLKTMGKQDIF